MPPRRHFALDVLPERLAICRLAPSAPIPVWTTAGHFFTISRTVDELSIICPASAVPAAVTASVGWQAVKLRGPLDLALVGVLVAVAEPLAAAGVGIMPIAPTTPTTSS